MLEEASMTPGENPYHNSKPVYNMVNSYRFPRNLSTTKLYFKDMLNMHGNNLRELSTEINMHAALY